MSDIDILLLRDLLNMGQTIVWMPDDKTARKVVKVGPCPSNEGDSEPSDVGFFANGDYVALWNCEAHHFVQVTPLFLPMP